MAQEPGPSGWPQEPHGPGMDGVGADARVDTANTDSCFCSRAPWQVGHSGCRAPWTSVSNRVSQSRQAYSKMGIRSEYSGP